MNEPKFKYYDRAIFMEINAYTNPRMCIEPVGAVAGRINGKMMGAVVPLTTRTRQMSVERSLMDKLKRRVRVTEVEVFDLNYAHARLLKAWKSAPTPVQEVGND